MFRHAGINDYFRAYYVGTLLKYSFCDAVILNTKDTYFLIIGPDQTDLEPLIYNAIKEKNGRIVYVSPKAINKNYDEDEARNTLVIFEFDEPVQV